MTRARSYFQVIRNAGNQRSKPKDHGGKHRMKTTAKWQNLDSIFWLAIYQESKPRENKAEGEGLK